MYIVFWIHKKKSAEYLRLNQVRILIEKTQQFSFGIVPKGTGIMLFFNLFFLGAERVSIKFGNDRIQQSSQILTSILNIITSTFSH